MVIGIRGHVKRLEYIPTELVENVQWSYHRVHRVAMATFWHTFHPRGCTPTPFHYIYYHVHIKLYCILYAPAEREDTLPLFLFLCTLCCISTSHMLKTECFLSLSISLPLVCHHHRDYSTVYSVYCTLYSLILSLYKPQRPNSWT